MHPYRRLLDRACRSLQGGSLTIDYWDGGSSTYGHGEPHVRLKLNHPGIVPRLLLDPEMAFGEGYTNGEIEVEGKIADLVGLISTNDAPIPAFTDALFRAAAGISRFKPLSMGRNRRDVSRHYDLGNDFYRLWLDPTMTYSCGYFRSPDDTLEAAQRRKIRHTLNKLLLEPGESLLDVGCGWGGLLLEAAERFGVNALGITLSEQQSTWFEKSRAESHPGATAEVALLHYHALADHGRAFDKIVSVGMAEHVGHSSLPGFFKDLKRLLKPGGLGLLHCITGITEEPTNAWIVKHIFPGGYIPGFGELARELTRQELIVWDVENLGQHYALTLDRWADAFERNVEWVQSRYGPEFVRMWRLYLRFSAASFRCDDLYVHQILFSNGKPDRLPLTREHLYTEGA